MTKTLLLKLNNKKLFFINKMYLTSYDKNYVTFLTLCMLYPASLIHVNWPFVKLYNNSLNQVYND